MNSVVPRKRLVEIFDQVIREITQQETGLILRPVRAELGGELCTVHAVFNRGINASLSLLAEMSTFVQLTRCIMQTQEVTPQDVEVFMKEYFNVLCGHIVSRLYQETKIPARFSIPVFYHGRFAPEAHLEHIALTYTSDGNGCVQLIHHIPSPRDM